MSPTVRNVLIVVGIAVVLTVSSGAFALAGLLVWIIQIGILLGILYFGWTLYRQNRSQIEWLPREKKALLYGAAALLVLTVVSYPLWVGGLATSLLFFALVGGCGYAIYRVWQDARRYY